MYLIPLFLPKTAEEKKGKRKLGEKCTQKD